MLSFANWSSFPVYVTGILNSQVPFCLQSTATELDAQTQPLPTAANLILISDCLFGLSSCSVYTSLLISSSSCRLDPQFVEADIPSYICQTQLRGCQALPTSSHTEVLQASLHRLLNQEGSSGNHREYPTLHCVGCLEPPEWDLHEVAV